MLLKRSTWGFQRIVAPVAPAHPNLTRRIVHRDAGHIGIRAEPAHKRFRIRIQLHGSAPGNPILGGIKARPKKPNGSPR